MTVPTASSRANVIQFFSEFSLSLTNKQTFVLRSQSYRLFTNIVVICRWLYAWCTLRL